MGTNQDYKNRALASLDGKWNNAVIATLIVFVISVAGGFFDDTISGVWSLLCLPLEWGFGVYFLNLIRHEDIAYNRLFDGYQDFVRIFLTLLLMAIFIIIGTCLLIVPGIIIALMVSQTYYIMKDDTQIAYLDAMKKSADMMKGHKMEFFWLALSFIGWAILVCLTFGLGFLLFMPYWNATTAHYYEDLKAEQNG